MSRLGWLARKPWGPACLLPQSWGGKHMPGFCLTWALRNQTQVVMLAWQTHY